MREALNQLHIAQPMVEGGNILQLMPVDKGLHNLAGKKNSAENFLCFTLSVPGRIRTFYAVCFPQMSGEEIDSNS